jgi:hypothetical protein
MLLASRQHFSARSKHSIAHDEKWQLEFIRKDVMHEFRSDYRYKF